jgi:hypothetical protein
MKNVQTRWEVAAHPSAFTTVIVRGGRPETIQRLHIQQIVQIALCSMQSALYM